MPQTPNDSSTNYIAKGFFFGLGFVPVFLILSALTSWFSYKIITHELSIELNSALTNAQIQNTNLQKNVVPQTRHNVAQELRKIAEISEASPLSDLEKKEQNCNLAILRYSQTNSPEDKKQVYAVCPEK
jgi:P pilus assembly chaperone PapD